MGRDGQQTTEVFEEYQDPRTGEHVQNRFLENGQRSSNSNNV